MSLNNVHAALSNDPVVKTLYDLPVSERIAFVNSLSAQEAEYLLFDWSLWARPNQLTPHGEWFTWLLMSGRGFGKTRVGSEWVLERVRNGYKKIAIIGRTSSDVRDTMVDVGPSSILKVARPSERPTYEPSKRRLTFPNGSIGLLYNGDEYEQLRGPGHDSAWVDELAKFQYPRETWDQLMFGLREGKNPQVCVTTTPKPIPLIKEIMKDARTILTTGSTFDNAANLSPAFLQTVKEKYSGTRLGRQELYGEIIGDVEGALWQYEWISRNRVKDIPEMKRIVVAIDIATTSNEKSDRTGITVCGLGVDNHGYLLADLSGIYTPDQWARKAIGAYEQWKASAIVAETNQGGDLIEHTLRTINRSISYKKVHASRGKVTRAEPIAALAEQNRIHHHGIFEELEMQMTEWVVGDESPDNLDSMVWAFTDLMVQDGMLGVAKATNRL